jgi:KDO2-lipid IV(A) lauroyltransferase
LKVGYGIAVLCSDIHYFFAKKDRDTVTANLKAIFPGKSDPEIAALRLAVFRNFAKYLVDFFRFEVIDKEYIRKYVKIKDIRYLDKALAEGKGAVILTAHLGNWELGGAVISLLGYPFWAVALAHKDKRINDFFNHQRESKNLHVMPLGNAVRKSLKLLKENKFVALVGDRDFTSGGVKAEFFGRPAVFPEGPAALSLQTKTMIIPGFMLRNKDDTFTLQFEKPVEFTHTGNKGKDTASIVRSCAAIFEEYIRKYPDQWFMFRRFWLQ